MLSFHPLYAQFIIIANIVVLLLVISKMISQ